MNRSAAVRCSLLAVSTLLAATAPRAQEIPVPAPELKKLQPLVGNWTGKGKMTEPTGDTTAWTANGTYAWALDGHFVREDFSIRFEGMDAPMVMRGYIGWDGERKRYVSTSINSAGEVALNEFSLEADGSMVQLSLQQHPGTRFAQRSSFKVAGDTMTHTVDILMPAGPSLALVDGTFTRGGSGFAGAFDGPTFLGAKPHESIVRLARSAGAYYVEGTMTTMPGQPAMKIHGVDTFRPVFGGTVFFGTTAGEAVGMPGKYSAEVYWGHHPARGCIVGVYVSNMGEVMEMDSRWSEDGKLVTTSASTMKGQPAVQRMLLEFDANGLPKTVTSHSIIGTAAPFESFRAIYAKKQ
jgi:hypothetical protein